MQLKRGLGRGLESLLPPPIMATPVNVSSETEERPFRMVPIDSVIPNRAQPRTVFDEEKIRELADSIRQQGIIQPLVVSQRKGGRFELIAGERRLRASRIVGLHEIPVIIKDTDDAGMLALSIIENIQREDLNPMEEAKAFHELMSQHGITQEDVATKVGRSRVAVANSLRLLKLPRVIQEDVACCRYSPGHARAILSIEGIHEQLKVRERIIRDMPTVRDVEKLVQAYSSPSKKGGKKRERLSTQMNDIADKMKQALGTKVQIAPKGNGGKIIIDYYSPTDLNRIYRAVTKS